MITLLQLMASLGFPYQFSLVFLQLFFYALTCYFLLKLSEELYERKIDPANIIIPFTLSFSVIFAWLGAMHTYNDFPQYCFLLIAFTFLIRKQTLLSAIFFSLAIVCRETSVLLLPIYAMASIRNGSMTGITSTLFWLTPIGLAAAMIFLYVDFDLLIANTEFTKSQRFTAAKVNFADFTKTRETIGTLVLTTGFAGFLVWTFAKSIVATSPLHRLLVQGFWYLLVVNTLLVSFSATAREARLFYLPTIIAIPLLAPFWPNVFNSITTQFSRKNAFSLLGAIVIAIIMALAYKSSLNGTGHVYRLYALFYFFIFALSALSRNMMIQSQNLGKVRPTEDISN
ncbi:EpsG family protein [Neolewinella agarilytica]|nr:EpsG family protein [Neolewinella agarilytica]